MQLAPTPPPPPCHQDVWGGGGGHWGAPKSCKK